MLSLLTPAAPTKAPAGSAPDAALPGGRADEATDAAGSFARALQDSSQALKQADATAADTPTATGRAEAADGRGPAHQAATGAGDPAEPRNSQRGASDRLRLARPGGRTAPGTDPRTTRADGLNASEPAGGRSRRAAEAAGSAAAASAPFVHTLPDPALVPAQATPLPAADGACATAAPPPDGPDSASTTAAAGDNATGTAASAQATGHGLPAASAAGPSAVSGGAAPSATPGTPSGVAGSAGGMPPAGPSAAFLPPGARPAPTIAGEAAESGQAAASTATAADTAGATGSALSGAAGASPDRSAPADPAATAPGAGAAALLGSIAIPTPVAAGQPGAPLAPAGLADAARRMSAGAARSATAAAAPGARSSPADTRSASRGGSTLAADAAGGPAAPNTEPARGVEPRTARAAAIDNGRSAVRDSATERGGAETGASTAAAAPGAATRAAAPQHRFADHLQAALPAMPVAGARAAEGSPSSPAVQAHIAAPLASPDFPPALGAQISLFARDGVERATIEIHPPEMGPISVQIALDGSAARVDFMADAAATRQVIESALPTLASSLRDAGLTLTGGGVFQQPQSSAGFAGHGGSAGQPGHGQGGRPGAGADDGLGAAGPATVLRTTAQRGLVDLVA